jgi:hypothetical protein
VALLPMQGCQIFLGTTYQNWKNVPNDLKLYQTALNYTTLPYKNLKQFEKYTKKLNDKALKNVPKLEFLVC